MSPHLSLIAPAHDEVENVAPLLASVRSVLDAWGQAWEFILIDDGSRDRTADEYERLANGDARLRLVRLGPGPQGQTTAFRAGIAASRGDLVAMIDADLQNDPEDLLLLLDVLESTGAGLVQGDRTRSRKDGAVRRMSSWVGRVTRRGILGDRIRDTGCSLRVMRRELAEALPLDFCGLHRFIPYMASQIGAEVVEVPVRHMPRVAGRSKYGIRNRAIVGLLDCLAVRWMFGRRIDARSVVPRIHIDQQVSLGRPRRLTPSRRAD